MMKLLKWKHNVCQQLVEGMARSEWGRVEESGCDCNSSVRDPCDGTVSCLC